MSFSSFAGGGGGGGVLCSVQPDLSTGGGGLQSESIPTNGGHELRPNAEIVYSMGQKDGSVNFAYGQLKNGQWQIQHVAVSNQDLTANEKAAIEKSEQTNQWVEILSKP